MGGENSEIKDDTSTVVFESATFHAGSVRLAAKKLGMRTESSSRFEKGLDSENTVPALNRACELVELLGAGEEVHDRMHGRLVKIFAVLTDRDADEEAVHDALQQLAECVEEIQKHAGNMK